MSLWSLLGGEVNHKRVAKWEREQQKLNLMEMKAVCRHIMSEGIPGAFKYTDTTEARVKFVLKKFSDCPIWQADNTWKIVWWGKSEQHINNWKQAQQWLYDQEHPKSFETTNHEVVQKELQEMKQKMQELEAKLAEYEKK